MSDGNSINGWIKPVIGALAGALVTGLISMALFTSRMAAFEQRVNYLEQRQDKLTTATDKLTEATNRLAMEVGLLRQRMETGGR